MAYGAILSLKLTMDRIFASKKILLSQSEKRFIHDELPDLDSFIETIAELPTSKIVDDAAASERRVKDAAQKLEDLIDSHLSDRLLLSDQSINCGDDKIGFPLLLSHQLAIVKQEVGSFLETLLNITDNNNNNNNISGGILSSSDYTSVGNQQQNLLVGLDDQIETLTEQILRPKSIYSVTSVLGMTGIGKTTLVKQVYNDPRIIREFETRLFVHIGPRYTRLEEIALLVLNQLGVDILLHENKDYVKKQLSAALSSKRYLIVLEDVWADVLYELQTTFFEVNYKQSHIIFISQIKNDMSTVFPVLFLKENESWKLLRQTSFSPSEDKECSRELEKIGKKIARKCEGLPMAIIQVGENLCGKSFEEWKRLSEKEDPLVITRDDHTPLSKALYFSYMMLPQKLKLCFLYMGVFPKNYVISRSKLIKLWLPEGFLDTYGRISYEDEAVGKYLDLLICRSVLMSERKTSLSINATKNCRLHFTFRSLCVNEAKSEFFLHILKKYTDCSPENIISQQRLCAHNNVVLAFSQVHEWMKSVPNARSLLCFGPKQPYPIVLPLQFRLLKILDALAIRFYEFPHQLPALFHLRYLAITCDGELPNSISRLWNLEVLIFGRHHNIKLLNNCPVYLPIEIWKLHKLKQLDCLGFDLPSPPEDSHVIGLVNLLTVSGVSVHSCTTEVLSRIPKLKRIAIQIESAHDSTETFIFSGHFASLYERFESFKCVVVNPNLGSHIRHCVPNFSVNIRKICLSGCGFPWKNMELIAALPNLAVLKLRWYAFCGPVWKTSGTQFPRLQFLLLEDLDIEHWESDGPYFALLRRVIFRHCYKLKNIPDQLKFADPVEVYDCSLSFVEKMRNWRSADDVEVKYPLFKF